MAKQTFTTGQVLTAAQMTSLQQTAMGGGSPSTKTASYVLTAADAGTVIQMNSASATTITVNTSLFAAGDSVQIQNIGAGVCTITAGTATVNSAGSLGVTQYDGGFLYFSSTSSAIWFDYTQAGTTLPLTTKGDLFGYDTGNARIPIGANDTVLTADSTQALGLKWAAPASGGGMTLLSTTTLSGASVTISSINQTYNDLQIVVIGLNNATGNYRTNVLPNGTADIVCTTGVTSGTARNEVNTNIRFWNAATGTGGQANATGNAFCINIQNYANATRYKPLNYYGHINNTDVDQTQLNSAGAIQTTDAITSLVINAVTGSFTGGTVLIYGVK